MPELPDVVVYLERLTALLAGRPLVRLQVFGPSLLQTYDPRPEAVAGRTVLGFRRIGKRIVWELEGGLFLVFHLMIAGRYHWKAGAEWPKTRPPKIVQALLQFDHGLMQLTEAGTKKRALLSIVAGEAALAEFDQGGLEVLEAGLPAFAAALRRENHTLKRSLTDPRLFSGIGNAYSDEILHRARLSPLRLTGQMNEEEIARLFDATRAALAEWTDRLRRDTGDRFPEKVTAFRPEMAVHGRFGQPCPVCGSPVQRIVYAENETNYCATCQMNGRLLADRAWSRLLREDWPRTLDELEKRKRKIKEGPN